MSFQMVVTQLNHPEIKSGQHTNGKPNIFIREDDTSPWYYVDGIRSQAKIRQLVECVGWVKFVSTHCQKVVD